MINLLIQAACELIHRESPVLVAATGLIFKKLSDTATSSSLEQVLESHRGGIWGDEAAEGYGYPVLRSTNMRGTKVDVTNAAWRQIPDDVAARYALSTGDILVTKSSGSTDLVGKAAIFSHPGNSQAYLFSNFTLRLRPNDELVEPRYLALFLRSPQALLWRFEAQQNAVGLRNLSTRVFLAQRVPLPNLQVQQAVADYLDSLEARAKGEVVLPPQLEEQRRIVERIDAVAARIEETRGLRQRSVEQTEALRSASSGQAFHSNWTRVPLEAVCSLITDGTHQTPQYVEEGYAFLSAQNVKPFRFMSEVHRKVSIEDYRSCQARAKPQVGDVLLTRVGAGIGEAAVIDRPMDFAFYVSLALIRPIPEKVLSEYIVHWLNSPIGLAQTRNQTLGRGHSQGNLNLNRLRLIQLSLPSIPDQRRIVADLDELNHRIGTLKYLQAETEVEFEALLPSLLDRAFKGEL